MCTYVIAIGGNALEENRQEISEILREIAQCVTEMSQRGDKVVLVHGNGPQIGKIVLQNHYAKSFVEENRMDECGAMTQALIGYRLQKELDNVFHQKGISSSVVTVLTQTIVDQKEVETISPTKPIGPYYTKEEADQMGRKEHFIFVEEAEKGYRRVVPSPMPLAIKELDAVKALLEQGRIVIAGGGGGIPVICNEWGELTGVAAVVDKDYTAEMIAEEILADQLILLTEAEYVAVDYGTKKQKNLEKIHTVVLKKYMEQGEFAQGSMLPKVDAAIKFAESRKGRSTVIGTVSKLSEIMKGTSGTVIYKE